MLPTALAIAGLDPSGGAGLAADLRSFGAAGVWGAAVCAALTVQSTRGVRAVRPVPAALVLEQAREVLADARVRAFKTGALGSAANARAVAALLADHPSVPSLTVGVREFGPKDRIQADARLPCVSSRRRRRISRSMRSARLAGISRYSMASRRPCGGKDLILRLNQERAVTVPRIRTLPETTATGTGRPASTAR